MKRLLMVMIVAGKDGVLIENVLGFMFLFLAVMAKGIHK
jgi:hypothetical protein